MVEATSLHDIAKAIIPENIINKSGTLTQDERKIMSEHARLSYEMLKTTNLDKETLDLIKNHHETHPTSGDSITNINLQILSIADVYSALREKRSYKEEMSKEEALTVLNEETQQGKFHPSVYKALVDYADKEEKSNNSNSNRQIFNFKPVDSLSA